MRIWHHEALGSGPSGVRALQKPVAPIAGKTGIGMPNRLLWIKHRHQRQKPQPRSIAINTVRVNQGLAQHLQATTNAQHRPALPGMRGNGSIQALRTQPRQIASPASSDGLCTHCSRTPGTFLSG